MSVRTVAFSNEKDKYSIDAELLRLNLCEKYSENITTNLCKSPPIYNVDGVYDGEEYVLDDYGYYQVWQLDENGNRLVVTRSVKNVGDGKKPVIKKPN